MGVASAPSFRGLSAQAGTTLSDVEIRRKRLRFRARSRGWLELDVLMGQFADKHIWTMEHDQLDLLEEILELENPDLFKWFTGLMPVPDEISSNEIMAMMIKHVNESREGGIQAPR